MLREQCHAAVEDVALRQEVELLQCARVAVVRAETDVEHLLQTSNMIGRVELRP
jgi:hypothetical protein